MFVPVSLLPTASWTVPSRLWWRPSHPDQDYLRRWFSCSLPATAGSPSWAWRDREILLVSPFPFNADSLSRPSCEILHLLFSVFSTAGTAASGSLCGSGGGSELSCVFLLAGLLLDICSRVDWAYGESRRNKGSDTLWLLFKPLKNTICIPVLAKYNPNSLNSVMKICYILKMAFWW